MKLVVEIVHPTPVDVCVDLCCGDVGVTEHFLEQAQVRSGLQKVGGETMPQRVGRKVRGDPGPQRIPVQNFPETHPG